MAHAMLFGRGVVSSVALRAPIVRLEPRLGATEPVRGGNAARGSAIAPPTPSRAEGAPTERAAPRPSPASAASARARASMDPLAQAWQRRVAETPTLRAADPRATLRTPPSDASGVVEPQGEATRRALPAAPLAPGATGPDVVALQDALVEVGALDEAALATGPGIYGPRTEAAVRHFQQAHGLAPSGRYDDATRAWLERRLAGEPAPPPPPPGLLPSSTTDANRVFLTQLPSAYNPTSATSTTNCGPASVAMALDAAGRMPPGLTPEERIDYARARMTPEVEPTSWVDVGGQRIPLLDQDLALAGRGQVRAALGEGSAGAAGWDALDAALDAGHPVVAHGHYAQSAWGATLEAAGAAQGYTGARAGGGDVGHFNAILGRTTDGRYVVADPMYTGGTVALTREQLAEFFTPTSGVPSFDILP
jgi:peptidoglycan hydrolase-like protein with peptidoglycan-binding domain